MAKSLPYQMAGRHGIPLNATVGNLRGDIYAIGFRTVYDPSSPYYGQNIFNNEGRFVGTNNIIKVGNHNLDCRDPKYLQLQEF
jgi:hypothetical protein